MEHDNVNCYKFMDDDSDGNNIDNDDNNGNDVDNGNDIDNDDNEQENQKIRHTQSQ